MTDTLFSEDKKEKEIKSYRELLVGPNAKFKDDEEMAKGKYFADADIAIKNKLLDEQRELILQQREQINASKSLEELLDQLKQRELANSENTQAKEVRETKPMNTDDIDLRIQQYEKNKKAKENLAIVNSKLEEQFGDKVSAVLKAKMNELDLSGEYLDNLAKQSPKAFFNTLGLDQKQGESFQSPPKSQVRSDNFGPKVEKRTWAWYKSKYKNRDFINNKDINVQMAKDAAELGDAFYDGDFYNSYHKSA